MTTTADFPTASASDASPVSLHPRAAGCGLDVAFCPDDSVVGRRIRVDGTVVLGRLGDGEPDVAIRDPALSRLHARVSGQGMGPFEVEDLGSRNGTWVNGTRVDREALAFGDVVRVGNTVCVFGLLPEGPPLRADIVARSAALVGLVQEVVALAPTDLPVVVVGETGTGKEVLARLLHDASGRRGRWVAVNCAAIPENLVESTLFGHRAGAFTGATGSAPGLFAEARGGTLLLDEVTELPLAHQAKLLRALESGEFTPVGSPRAQRAAVRVVCATNADLAAEVAAGTFRRDLFGRLTGAVLRVPPLRRRRMDVVPLARHFWGDGDPPWTAGYVESLLLQPWPLNARGLRNTVARTRILAPEGPLTRSVLRAAVHELGIDISRKPPPSPDPSVPDADRLCDALRTHRGIVARVARQFGKDPKQVYRWIDRHGIDLERYRH